MMFPMPMPEMPQEIMDAVSADPGAFAAAIGDGMEAFQGAMADGGDMGAAFEAMGDVMGPVMQDMGVSPEAFDAAGDALGAAVGGGMHMGPADMGGPEMGACIQDAVDLMLPEGMDMPAPVMDACMDMGQGFADAGCAPHDMAGEMMPPPGEPGFPMPCDASGDCIVPAGDPAACPADACQPPPMDGACADMGGTMMPPEGGYEHAPMPADAVMPPPIDPPVDVAMAPPGDMAAPPPGDMAAPMGDMDGNMAPVDADGGMGALGDALGGPPAGDPAPAPMDAADAAIGAAMDGAMDQGGAPAPADAGAAPADDAAGAAMADDDQGQPDPSAGMG